MPEDQIKCPHCGSTQIHAERRGWSIWTGLLGSGQITITCLACGGKFRPGAGVIGDAEVVGTVTKIDSWDCVYVRLDDGRPGFIHVSNLAKDYVEDASEIVSVGDRVEARIIPSRFLRSVAGHVSLKLIAVTEEDHD